jgi:hypothetical protein
MALFSSFRQAFIPMSAGARFLILAFLVLFFFLIGSLLAVLLAMPIYHHDLVSLANVLKYPDDNNIAIVRFFQIIQSVTMFIVPALVAAWMFSLKPGEYLNAEKNPSPLTLSLVLVSLITVVPAMNMIAALNARLDLPVSLSWLETEIKAWEESAEKLTQLFLKSNSWTDLTVNLIMIAVLPAIGEEFLFRGHLQKLFIRMTRNNHAGIIISALLFSFIHLQFYGFLPRFLLGLYFGYLLFWSGSIWVPVTAHLINNGVAVLYYHFAGDPMGETVLDKAGTGEDGNYIVYLSVFITSLVIAMIYLQERNKGISIFNRNRLL